MKPSLRSDQIADLGALIRFNKFGLWHDPGGGKTPIAAVFSYYCWNQKGWRSVWAMPKSLLAKNRDEIIRFSNFEDSDVVALQGTPKERDILMRSDAKVFLTTFTGWSKDGDKLLEYHPDIKCNVIDEIHLGYSGHKAARTQNWYLLSRQMEAIVPMTGTVIKGKLDSAYPILHAMAPHYYGSHEAFMNYHCVFDEYGNKLGWKNHERLGLVLQAIGVRRSLASIYGEQAKIFNIEKCQMSKGQAKLYEDFAGTGLIELEDSFIEAKGGGAKAIRARQILAHPETFGVKEVTGKDERLWTHIEDHIQSEEPLCIFSALVPEQERIYQAILARGFKVGLINGGVSGDKRQQIDKDFREGKLQFVVGSPACMAVGFNWGFVNHIIYVSIDYGDDSFIQAYSRAIRGVRPCPLLITVLEYENSIDQDIFEIVQGKSKDANLIDETKEEIILTEDLTDWLKKGLKT